MRIVVKTDFGVLEVNPDEIAKLSISEVKRRFLKIAKLLKNHSYLSNNDEELKKLVIYVKDMVQVCTHIVKYSEAELNSFICGGESHKKCSREIKKYKSKLNAYKFILEKIGD